MTLIPSGVSVFICKKRKNRLVGRLKKMFIWSNIDLILKELFT